MRRRFPKVWITLGPRNDPRIPSYIDMFGCHYGATRARILEKQFGTYKEGTFDDPFALSVLRVPI